MEQLKEDLNILEDELMTIEMKYMELKDVNKQNR